MTKMWNPKKVIAAWKRSATKVSLEQATSEFTFKTMLSEKPLLWKWFLLLQYYNKKSFL